MKYIFWFLATTALALSTTGWSADPNRTTILSINCTKDRQIFQVKPKQLDSMQMLRLKAAAVRGLNPRFINLFSAGKKMEGAQTVLGFQLKSLSVIQMLHLNRPDDTSCEGFEEFADLPKDLPKALMQEYADPDPDPAPGHEKTEEQIKEKRLALIEEMKKAVAEEALKRSIPKTKEEIMAERQAQADAAAAAAAAAQKRAQAEADERKLQAEAKAAAEKMEMAKAVDSNALAHTVTKTVAMSAKEYAPDNDAMDCTDSEATVTTVSNDPSKTRYDSRVHRIQTARSNQKIESVRPWSEVIAEKGNNKLMTAIRAEVKKITDSFHYTHSLAGMNPLIEMLYDKGYNLFGSANLPDYGVLVQNALRYLDREKDVMDENEKGRDRDGNMVSVWLIDPNNAIKYLSYRIAFDFVMYFYPDDEGKIDDTAKHFSSRQIDREQFAKAYNKMHEETYLSGKAIERQHEKFIDAMTPIEFTVMYDNVPYKLVVSKRARVRDLMEQLAWEVESDRLEINGNVDGKTREERCLEAVRKASFIFKISSTDGKSYKEHDNEISAVTKITELEKMISPKRQIAATACIRKSDDRKAWNTVAFKYYHKQIDGALNQGKDWEEAFRLFDEGLKKEKEEVEVDSYANVGHMFAEGLGGRPNHRLAVFYFLTGAGHNCATCYFNLGAMYSGGRGVPKSKTLALKYYLKSSSLAADAERRNEAKRRAEWIRTYDPEDAVPVKEVTLEEVR